ncbi:hypothetical protein LCGC14_1500810 [marine sediment metagenome]|uniref:Uncharacterized protein n=1 Tax=marine sediment metagenome TaxID=412755 RepID=A0A0F9LJU2_9ZZZZ
MNDYTPPKWHPETTVEMGDYAEVAQSHIAETLIELRLATKDLKSFRTWCTIGKLKDALHHAEVASRLLHSLDDLVHRLTLEELMEIAEG